MNEKSIKLKNDGCIIFKEIIKPELFEKLKAGYHKYWSEIKFEKKEGDIDKIKSKQEKIIDYCPEILELLNNVEIKEVLDNYIGKDFKITGIYGTRAKPLKYIPKEDDLSKPENKDYNILFYHHDQDGKQIKLIIPFNDIDENQNCLEYAVGSNKTTFLDKLIIKFLRFFGFYKNWEQPIFWHLLNRLTKKNNFQYYDEKKVKKKYETKKITVKERDIYLFDTSGYHRQSTGNENTDYSLTRETIFIDLMPYNEWYKNKKIIMNFNDIKKENYSKISKFL